MRPTPTDRGRMRNETPCLAACPAHIRPAIALMMFTGLGPRDALTLPRSFYKANEIATKRSKTGEPVFWPCPAPLTAILAEAPAHDAITLCANSDGKPWTVSGFRASWRKVRVKLEHEGKVGPGAHAVRPAAYRGGDPAGDRHATSAPSPTPLGRRRWRWPGTTPRAPTSSRRCAAWSARSRSNWTNEKQKCQTGHLKVSNLRGTERGLEKI